MNSIPAATTELLIQPAISETTSSALTIIAAAITAIAGAALFCYLSISATTVFSAGLLFGGLAVTLLSGIGGGIQTSVILDEILKGKSHPGFHLLTVAGAIVGFLFGGGWAGAILGWLISPTACALSAMCCCGCYTKESDTDIPDAQATPLSP